MLAPNGSPARGPNVNVGIMGHVDAGKTTLARWLSTTASTASFDKSPQSQLRGITLDLGFSAFPLGGQQVTLVDCPGHASLIRSVIGAASIIDAVLLVVDALEGVQVQTAECLVLAGIVTERLVVALTKIDLIPEDERNDRVEVAKSKMQRALRDTQFANCPIVPVSANADVAKSELFAALHRVLPSPPVRDLQGPALVVVDHCFAIKGHGAVMTGTVLKGILSIGDKLVCEELPGGVKIKSIQSFKQSLPTAGPGDRVGLCVGTVDTSAIERTVLSAPGSVESGDCFLMDFEPIRYFRRPLRSRTKFHFSVFHETAVGVATFLRPAGAEYEYLEEEPKDCCVLVQLSKRVPLTIGQLVVASRLDTDTASKSCRLAFHGTIRRAATADVKIFKWKDAEFRVDRIVDAHRVIGKDVANNNAAVQRLLGLEVQILDPNRQVVAAGRVESPFGASGKFNISVSSSAAAAGITGHRAGDLRIVCRRKAYYTS